MYLLSDVGCYSDAQNAKYDIVGEIPRHPDLGSADARKVEHNVRDGGFSQMKRHRMQMKIGIRVEQVNTDEYLNVGDTDIRSSSRYPNSSPMDAVSHETNAISPSDNVVHLDTLFNEMTGTADGKTILDAILSLSALLMLNDIAVNRFSHSSGNDDFLEMVVIRPDTIELNVV